MNTRYPKLTEEMLDEFVENLTKQEPTMTCLMSKSSVIEWEKKTMEGFQLNQDYIDSRVRFLEQTMEDKSYLVRIQNKEI